LFTFKNLTQNYVIATKKLIIIRTKNKGDHGIVY